MSKFSGIEKTAILLTVLGEDIAAALLREMSPDEVKRILSAMGRLSKLDQKTAEAVLAEFQEALTKPGRTLPTGGHEYVSRVIGQAFSGDAADEFAEFLKQTSPQLTALAHAEADQIALVMRGQRPQTWAIVVASLEPERAAQVLKAYPEDQQADLLLRIAGLGEVSAEAIEELNEWLEEELKASERRQALKLGGVQQVAAILSQMDSASEKRAVEGLRERDDEAATQIEKYLFTFDDLRSLSDQDMQKLLLVVDSQTLLVALRKCGDAVKEKIFSNLSKRASELLQEDLAAMKPMRVSDVEEAQQKVISQAKDMEEKGEIDLSNDQETYV